MSNIVEATPFINYISEFKKIFVTSSGAPISQMFKIDSQIDDFYYFKIINSRNQTVSLHNRSFEIYGSYIDAKSKQHILFHNSSYAIEDNVLIFRINTYTDKYLEYVTTQKTINITIVETTTPITQVVLRDNALAYPRPYIDGKDPQQIVEYETLTGLTVPVSGSFAAGTDISLVPEVLTYAFGQGLITNNANQLVVGSYNVPDADQVFVVANGTSNHRKNLFTVNSYGQAYLSGVRVLTANDRTNVSQLANDIGYITIADVPVYHAGTGLALNGYTFSLTASIPSSVEELSDGSNYALKTYVDSSVETVSATVTSWVNDQGYLTAHQDLSNYALKSQIPTNNNQLTNGAGYITGYNAGSGISITNGTINCTVEGGGAEYTAGTGIGISDQNVISLTATIPTVPTNVGAFTNDVGYLSSLVINIDGTDETQMTSLYLDNNFYIYEGMIGLDAINIYQSMYDNGLFVDYALTSDIPLSTSQLTNNNGFITSSYVNSQGFIRSITVGEGLNYNAADNNKIDVTNQKRYARNNYPIEYNDNYWILYQKDKCIYDVDVQTNNGIMTVKPLRLTDNTIDCRVATVELWLTPSGTLTGVQIASGLTLTNQLPSKYLNYNTQVFDINLFKNSNGRVSQTVQYKYQFDKNEVYHIELDPIPQFSFKYTGTETTTTSSIVNYIHYNGEQPLTYQIDGTLPDGVTFSNGVFTCVPSSIEVLNETVNVNVIISATDAIASVTCTVQIKVQNSSKFSSIPLTIEAIDNCELMIVNDSDPGTVTLYWNKNNTGWSQIMINGDTQYLDPGDTVAISGDNSTGFNNGADSPYRIQISNGNAKAYGNIMSLLTGNYENATDFNFITNKSYVFRELFNNQTYLVDAEYIVLPALDVPQFAYYNTFNSCGSLTAAPALPATGLASYAYYCMFAGSYSLTDAPYLPSAQLADSCYENMFQSCTSLTSMHVGLTEWQPAGTMNPTNNWLDNVGSNGIFTCPSALGTPGMINTGNSYCPDSWTVVNDD